MRNSVFLLITVFSLYACEYFPSGKEVFRNHEYIGIIKQKIDKGADALIIIDTKDTIWLCKATELWDKTSIGDSIIKRKGVDEIHIKNISKNDKCEYPNCDK